MKEFPKLKNNNEMYTPEIAMDYIMKFLPKDWIYWECCYGQGHMAKTLSKNNFNVIGYRDLDCLINEPAGSYDCIITNPPFNGNKKFVKRAIELNKPFVFLLRLEHLGGVEACRLLQNLDIQIVIPEKRINYMKQNNEKSAGSPFHSIFLTYKLKLPKQINYIKL